MAVDMAVEVKLYRITPVEPDSGTNLNPRPEAISHDSRFHPAHPFKVGYFYSPYTPQGFDNVLSKMTGETLASIFGVISPKDELILPDWKRAKARIQEVRQKLADHVKDCGGIHNVATISVEKTYRGVDSAEGAMKQFRQEMSRYRKNLKEDNIGNYTSLYGEFMFETPWKVVAVIPGTTPYGKDSHLCCYIVYEEDARWYFDAISIIWETIDFVLNQPDPQNYRLGWTV